MKKSNTNLLIFSWNLQY